MNILASQELDYINIKRREADRLKGKEFILF